VRHLVPIEPRIARQFFGNGVYRPLQGFALLVPLGMIAGSSIAYQRVLSPGLASCVGAEQRAVCSGPNEGRRHGPIGATRHVIESASDN